ncbi:hypothetical protein SBOR_1501 [Sclerotinia borealis F-4128]|uniref:Uncharacterized protein n=1 Tax=Sclerotinia borealis (strain F-4128) TaxID=1432307 RepID=W9CMT9_SCLBF|nr:hypothetical protein SBOR_1501 [Sclerotinia borealis F-4128]
MALRASAPILFSAILVLYWYSKDTGSPQSALFGVQHLVVSVQTAQRRVPKHSLLLFINPPLALSSQGQRLEAFDMFG